MSNPYLAGNYAPVEHEQTLTDLDVTGAVPEFLDGQYVRNGPNPISEVDPQTYHWFVGDGMVHGVRLRDGRAEWYRNRWVRSPGAAAALGEAPPAAVPSRLGARGLGANTHVIGHAGRILALVESGIANYELDEHLDTVGPCDFGGTLTGGYTAHPKRDPATGELHAVSYHFGRPHCVQYSVLDTHGHARRTVDIEVTGSPMMHDLALTETHVVFFDLPVTFDVARAAGAAVPRWLRKPSQLVLSALVGRVRVPDPLVAMAFAAGRNVDLPYSWDPDYPARIGVMPREGTAADVRWFDIDPCFVFHTLGAYDEPATPQPASPEPDVSGSVAAVAGGIGAVVVDAVRHRRSFVADAHGPDEGSPQLHRWRLDLSTGRASGTVLDDHGQEFPRMDERTLSRPYRFGYSIGLTQDSGAIAGDALVRHDLTAGVTTRRSLGPDAQGGEFVFVPRQPDAAEDDGVLMGYVYDPHQDRSRLCLRDAATLDPVADIQLPTRVPHGFHGNWLTAST